MAPICSGKPNTITTIVDTIITAGGITTITGRTTITAGVTIITSGRIATMAGGTTITTAGIITTSESRRGNPIELPGRQTSLAEKCRTPSGRLAMPDRRHP